MRQGRHRARSRLAKKKLLAGRDNGRRYTSTNSTILSFDSEDYWTGRSGTMVVIRQRQLLLEEKKGVQASHRLAYHSN